MIHQFAYFKIYEEKLHNALECIKNFVLKVHANEVNTILYISLQSQENKLEFTHYIIFKDEEAENYHKNTFWVKEFVDQLYPLYEIQPKFIKQNLLVPSIYDVKFKFEMVKSRK